MLKFIPTPPGTYSHVDKRGYLKLSNGHWYARCRGRWVSVRKSDIDFNTLIGRTKYERKLKLGVADAYNFTR